MRVHALQHTPACPCLRLHALALAVISSYAQNTTLQLTDGMCLPPPAGVPDRNYNTAPFPPAPEPGSQLAWPPGLRELHAAPGAANGSSRDIEEVMQTLSAGGPLAALTRLDITDSQ